MDCKIILNRNLGTPYKIRPFNTQARISHPFAPTPLLALPSLANFLGLNSIHIKDESKRGTLGSFKCLGAYHAVERILTNSGVLTGKLTFSAATDGNHGLGVASAASAFGCPAIIRMPYGSSQARINAIRKTGAHCTVSQCNYDETIAQLIGESSENGWQIVQDTAWEGYEDIPLWIIQGYGILAREIISTYHNQQLPPPTHIFLQAGVGSFAAAMVANLSIPFPDSKFFLVEPKNADCFFQSFKAGAHQSVSGSLQTIMAGLACGVPNPLVWPMLRSEIYASIVCADWLAACAMRMLASPLPGDPRIWSGESGAAGLSGLIGLLLASESGTKLAGIDSHSRVLLINTEMPMDPGSFGQIIWGGDHPAPQWFQWPLEKPSLIAHTE